MEKINMSDRPVVRHWRSICLNCSGKCPILSSICSILHPFPTTDLFKHLIHSPYNRDCRRRRPRCRRRRLCCIISFQLADRLPRSHQPIIPCIRSDAKQPTRPFHRSHTLVPTEHFRSSISFPISVTITWCDWRALDVCCIGIKAGSSTILQLVFLVAIELLE